MTVADSSVQDEKAWEDKAQIAQTMKLQTRLGQLEKQLSGYRQLQTAVSDVRELAGTYSQPLSVTSYSFCVQNSQTQICRNSFCPS